MFLLGNSKPQPNEGWPYKKIHAGTGIPTWHLRGESSVS